MITVAKDNSGDFDSIQRAVDSVSDNISETIYIKKGIYKERVEIRKNNITLIGENTDETIITEGFYARMIMPDGSRRGTFRSYTFLVYADNFCANNITFENSAGFGDNVDQAIAVYAEGDNITFKNCKILGHQDTLFTGPLPLKEKLPGGFTGPTIDGRRRLVHQLYDNCFISGEIDFIFGSAAAYFKDCTLFALNRNQSVNAYYTAPSTYEGQAFGYVFDNCTFTGNCPPKSVALSRPWRIHAKTVLLNCNYSDQIIDEGFTDWNKPESHDTVYYAEYNGHGEGFKPEKRAAYVHQLDESEAALYTLENVMNS